MLSNLTFTLLNESRIIQFAKQQFINNASLLDEVIFRPHIIIGTYAALSTSNEQLAEQIASSLAHAHYTDEFVIYGDETSLYIIGVSERAALFGVYHYFEHEFGFKWALPHTENVKARQQNKFHNKQQHHIKPLLERRGIVVETIDDIPFLQALVDWLAKNKINELFLTFTLYDKVKKQLDDMLLDRGISLTLGGHSASFFLQQLKSDTIADHPYTAKKQLDYGDLSWQPSLISEIVNYCREVKPLTRLSLWPEDIKHQSKDHFLPNYIAFTNRLREGFVGTNKQIEVEHIAYNAGLAWDMLEAEQVKLLANVDTLYAYWGRDYSLPFNNDQQVSDKRGYAALLDWINKTNNSQTKLTVFEYYSDHFMLSPLFPMLASRIEDDIKNYKSLGINGITNLIVPCREEHYPYQWNQYFNSFVYARALWNESTSSLLDYFVAHLPSELQLIYKEWLHECENKLALLTKWNAPLFPARAVDYSKVSEISDHDKAEIIGQMQCIVQLASSFLEKPEVSQLPEFKAVLMHYINYAHNAQEQWQLK